MTIHQPCPDCGSSDALVDYGTRTKCFSCGTFKMKNHKPERSKGMDLVPTDMLSYVSIPKRHLSATACSKASYAVSGKRHHVANYYDSSGELVAQKLRDKDKNFVFAGDPKRAALFMQQLWTSGPRIIITEGEIDAVSIAQAFGFHRSYACVSVPNGANGAAASLKKELRFLQQFDEVVLAFDNDPQGTKAVKECVGLFKPGTVCVVNYGGSAKDANDVLRTGGAQRLVATIKQAKRYMPEGVFNAADLWDDLNVDVAKGTPWPWPSVTTGTYGIRPAELITVGAGVGSGKTDFFKEIEAHLVTVEKKRVGVLHLEEQKRDTLLGIMSKAISRRLHIDPDVTEKTKKKAFTMTTDDGRLTIFDSFGETDFDVIYNTVRYMVTALGVEVVFLDHVTALTDGLDVGDNVNQAVKRMMNRLASLTRELSFTLFVISHLRKAQGKPHEEGGRVVLDDLYGSAAIKQWSSFVFALERNQQAEDLHERNTTVVRCLKDRYTGQFLGRTVRLFYDVNTGRSMEKAAREEDKDCGF